MLELLFAVALGVLLGMVAGILPGIHPNTLIPVLLGATVFLDPLSAAIILVVAGVINGFVSFIPSVLLGAPEDSTVLSVLPGHKLLLEGRGYEAVKLATVGGLGATVLAVVSLPLFSAVVPSLYAMTRPHLWWLLSLVLLYLIVGERKPKPILFAALTVLLSGALGLIVLNNLGDGMLFPMLSGLFGLPLLLLSARGGVTLPERISFEETKLPKRVVAAGILTGTIAGVLAGLLPGIGSSQAAVFAQLATDRSKEATRQFLIALGSVNSADVVLSIFALWLIHNPRSGIAVAVGELLPLTTGNLVAIISTVLFAAGLGAYLTLKLSRRALLFLRRLNYSRLCVSTALFVTGLVVLMTGLAGFAVLIVSAAIGLIPNLSGVRRSLAMACLIVPTIFYFL